MARRYNEYVEPPKHPCRIKGCTDEGHNRYCLKHTPKRGSGLLPCDECGRPLAQHKLRPIERCLPR